MELTNEAVEGELEDSYVRKSDGTGWDGGCVPGRPRQSFRRLHHPTLQLANSPYLERNEVIGRVLGCKEEMERTLTTMDGEKVQKSERGK
jgi:hypothetical protein